MKTLAELEQFDLATASQTEMAAVIQVLQERVRHDAKLLQAKDIKIEKLAFELAHLRRMRYGVKNEALTAIQLNLFEETLAADAAAVEAEIEQIQDEPNPETPSKAKRPAPAGNPYPIICRVLSIAMSRTLAPAANAARI